MGAIVQFKINHIPCSSGIVVRLLEIYGRSPEHTAVMQHISEWSKEKTGESWAEYNKVLDGKHFPEDHPSLFPTPIAYAKLGFQNYEVGDRII